jgi:L-arabonate dehydrase
MDQQNSPDSLRSASWFAAPGKSGVIHRSHMHNQGFANDVMSGRPVIGIASTWSELTPCNAHLNRIAASVKRGVWESGGFPLEFPTMSLGETLMRPTTSLYRNLLAMEAEELMRANPLDGVVLLSGCDKTTPGLLMAAASVDLPTIMVTGGPMLNGKFRGQDVGSGTDVWRLTEEERAGNITSEDLAEVEICLARSSGHCMTMGTASTMACIVEALGMTLPGGAAIPAVDSRRSALAQVAGRRIVDMVRDDLRMSKVVTRKSLDNAIMVNAAIGGSTNAIVHLLAIAGRLEISLELKDFDELGSRIPLLVNLQPSGKFLMEEFAYAGGLPVVLNELRSFLHNDALTVTGRSIGDNNADAPCYDESVIASVEKPIMPAGSGTAVLFGNLAPKGAVIKISAASRDLLTHTGPALVYDSIDDYHAAKDDPDLAVTPETILVIRNCGPRGYPGFPEVGNAPMPAKLLKQGITDMVRISDARMSGTAYGTCVLHVAPEAAAGGPLSLVRTGDMITLDVPNRTLSLLVDDQELASRTPAPNDSAPKFTRGWTKLYIDHVEGADTGADLDFLRGRSGSGVGRDSH